MRIALQNTALVSGSKDPISALRFEPYDIGSNLRAVTMFSSVTDYLSNSEDCMTVYTPHCNDSMQPNSE